MKIQKHAKMYDLDVAALQSVADGIAPGVFTITHGVNIDQVHEADTRRGHEGRNKLATKSHCEACQGGTKDVLDAENYPTRCLPCDGYGEIEEHPHIEHPFVEIDCGHRSRTGVPMFEHIDGISKNRKDLFRVRTQPEMAAEVARQIGFAAFENAKAVSGHPGIDHDLALAFLDIAQKIGHLPPALIENHRRVRLACASAGVTVESVQHILNDPQSCANFVTDAEAGAVDHSQLAIADDAAAAGPIPAETVGL